MTLCLKRNISSVYKYFCPVQGNNRPFDQSHMVYISTEPIHYFSEIVCVYTATKGMTEGHNTESHNNDVRYDKVGTTNDNDKSQSKARRTASVSIMLFSATSRTENSGGYGYSHYY